MPPGIVLEGVDGLRAAVGTHLGYSGWLKIDQRRIDGFARATGDDQWIHVDEKRAAEGPYGATIAHGYLTLALSNFFLPQILTVKGFTMGINYGLDRARFPSPVPVESSLRCGAELTSLDEISGGVQTAMTLTLEIADNPKPGCVLVALSRWLL